MWVAAAVWAALGCVAGIGLAQKATTPAPAKAKASPAVLLERGIYTEETVGDLDAAIKVYQQIVDDAKANRPYAAQAQYRLAMCYLKKGDKAKAAAELRQLLASYPQEKDIAAQAQKELAKLSPPLRGPAAFGPVIEKTLNDLDDGRGHEGLDLQSGRQFDVPKEREWSKVQRLQWIKENGIDLFVENSDDRALIVFDLKLEAVHQRWDDISPEFLQTVTASGNSKTEMIERGGNRRIYPIQDMAKPPLTFALKTANGELGILQIVEFVDKPKSVKIRYKLLEYAVAPAADAAPRALRTTPEAFANDVDPSLDKITVTFDRPMTDKSWSWTGGGETFPKIQTPSYDAARTTCTLPVKLQAGKVYWVGINSPSYRNFRAEDGTPAARYVIVFATKSADGKPTPLPDDMVNRARAINEASARAGVPRLPQEVMGYIISKHYEAARNAQEKRLRVNTHIYGVDDRFALYSGGLLGYVNSSDKPQAGPIHLGNFGREKPNYTLMDEAGRPQRFELRQRPSAKLGQYGLWWKPDQPVQPGANRLLGYIRKDVRMLPLISGSAQLTMKNTFGSLVLENFFLVLPRGMTIVEPSGPPTSKTTVGQFDIYQWQKQVPFNTRHFVTMGLKAPDAPFAAMSVGQNAALIVRLRNAEQQAERFISNLRQGRTEEAYKRTTEQYRQHHRGLSKFTEVVDLSQAKPVQILVAEAAACVIVSPVIIRKEKKSAAMGLGMIRFGEGYLIRDLDCLPDDKAIEKFVAGFKKANPSFVGPIGSPNGAAEALKAKLINWVEKYFSENHRDITARKTIEWGDPEPTAGGNLSIRYKYIATIRNKSKKIIEQRFTFTPEGKYVSAATIERRQAPLPESVKRVWKVIVEDLATQMLVAIRDKDDAALKAMATDRFKGWTEALPKFALEAREKFLQKTKKSFQMFAGESVVLGNVAAVKCTGPKELNGIYLALFFVKTEGGWKNFCLRNSPSTIPLTTHLRKVATEIGVQLPAAVDAAGKKAAVSAAEQWLKLVDDGKYGASWDTASALLRKAVAKDAFAKQIQAARKPLGKVRSRKVMLAICMTSMPGAPDGQYVVVQLEAVFENKKQAVETITPMKCKDGKWRVSGYYIK